MVTAAAAEATATVGWDWERAGGKEGKAAGV